MSTLNGMKYLVFSDGTSSYEWMMIFPAFIQHSDFARMVLADRKLKAIRGGFVCFTIYDADGNTLEGKFKCYGESISLCLQSDPDKDLALLYRELVKE